ncbi:unnamed protein product, partial [Ectocarpus sp. 4 AP-2014]
NVWPRDLTQIGFRDKRSVPSIDCCCAGTFFLTNRTQGVGDRVGLPAAKRNVVVCSNLFYFSNVRRRYFRAAKKPFVAFACGNVERVEERCYLGQPGGLDGRDGEVGSE